jgi:hypothetical protein
MGIISASTQKGYPAHRMQETRMVAAGHDLRRRENAGIACWSKLEITPPSISCYSPYGTAHDLSVS